MTKPIQIAVVGSGYVGLVAAVCFAEIGHNVVCVDNDERKVAALESGDTLIHEKHLPELLARYHNTRIRFTTNLHEATRDSQAIFIAVGTPQSEAGDADLSYVEAVACEIARSLTSYKVIVEKSTVPVYTNEWIRRAIERNGVARRLFDELDHRIERLVRMVQQQIAFTNGGEQIGGSDQALGDCRREGRIVQRRLVDVDQRPQIRGREHAVDLVAINRAQRQGLEEPLAHVGRHAVPNLEPHRLPVIALLAALVRLILAPRAFAQLVQQTDTEQVARDLVGMMKVQHA